MGGPVLVWLCSWRALPPTVKAERLPSARGCPAVKIDPGRILEVNYSARGGGPFDDILRSWIVFG